MMQQRKQGDVLFAPLLATIGSISVINSAEAERKHINVCPACLLSQWVERNPVT